MHPTHRVMEKLASLLQSSERAHMLLKIFKTDEDPSDIVDRLPHNRGP